MIQRSFFLLALLMIVFTARGQMDLRIGPSVGLMTSRFPNQASAAADFDAFIPHAEPRLGFLVGVNGRLHISDHWSCVVALEYHNFGETTHGQATAMGPQMSTWHWEYTYVSRYHKLAIPFLMSFSLGKGKVRPSFQAGLRTGLMVHSMDLVESIVNGSEPSTSQDDTFDAFPVRLQALTGLGVDVGDNWFFGFQMANPWLFPATKVSSQRFNDFDLNFQVAFRPWALGSKKPQ